MCSSSWFFSNAGVTFWIFFIMFDEVQKNGKDGICNDSPMSQNGEFPLMLVELRVSKLWYIQVFFLFLFARCQ